VTAVECCFALSIFISTKAQPSIFMSLTFSCRKTTQALNDLARQSVAT
jgi:hypothetical protein